MRPKIASRTVRHTVAGLVAATVVTGTAVSASAFTVPEDRTQQLAAVPAVASATGVDEAGLDMREQRAARQGALRRAAASAPPAAVTPKAAVTLKSAVTLKAAATRRAPAPATRKATAAPARRATAAPATRKAATVRRAALRSAALSATRKPASRSFTRKSLAPRDIAKAMLPARGWRSQYNCLNKLWTKESNWRVTADNPTSSAYGIPQALPGSKMRSAGADWRTNPATQITWGLRYIAGRYSSPCAAWSHSRSHNWY